jgi:cellobiose transport system permease protein
MEAMTAAAMVRRSRRPRVRPARIVLHGVLAFGALVCLFPFYWLLVMSSNRTSDTLTSPPVMVPGGELLTNVAEVFDRVDFFGSIVNTLIVAVSVAVLVLFFDSLAAFAFAKFQFPFRNVLFAILLGTFMLPMQLAVIPQYITMINLGWVGQLQALIIPAAANAFGIFWLRQYISAAVPDELLDACTIDGGGFFRQYVTVCLPLIRPGLGFLGIFTFIASWNDYLWPLVVLNDPNRITLQVAMAQLNRAYGFEYGLVMAGALITTLPLVIVFLLGARQFIGDIARGAVK